MRSEFVYFMAFLVLVIFSNVAASDQNPGCPPGAATCFLCGGLDGIACDQNCPSGPNRPGLGIVACECPQGGACTCYCPYGGGVATTGSGQVAPPSALVNVGNWQGSVYVLEPGGKWAKIVQEIPLKEGYQLKTGHGSKVAIRMSDGSKIFLDEDTTLEIKELYRPKSASTLDVIIELINGAIFSDVTKRDGTKFEVEPSVSVAGGVKGTKFAVYDDKATGNTIFKSLDGVVSVWDKNGNSVDIDTGQMMSHSEASGLGRVMEFDIYREMLRWNISDATNSSINGFVF
jgi:hypothetical protein